MLQFPEKRQEPGRNDPCPCGSDKKYKNCCLKKKEFLAQKIDLTTMLKLLYCLVKGIKGQSVIVTKRTVDERVPENWMEEMNITPGMVNGKESYIVSVKKEKQPVITTPQKRILLPGEN